MKTIPYNCIQDLQPDGCEPEPEPVMCRCGHEQDWHAQVGPCFDCEGVCEADGCPCGGFQEEGDEDDEV